MKRKPFFYLMILFILFSFLFVILKYKRVNILQDVYPIISQERGFQVVRKEGRIALIIGNGRYKSSPLRNPINDAADMARVLRERGFEVILRTDANHKEMEKAIREFGGKLRQGGIGFFYFSGHGMQVKGVNYLVPVDEDIQEEDEIKFKAVDANFVLSKMDSAGNQMNVMILDACRDNPFIRSFRSSARGLAQMDAPRGSLIVYATSPGKTAADGEGRNGIFTKHLLKAIRETNLEVGQLLREVRRGVMNETDSNQVPWESSSLIGNFYFSSQPKPAEPVEAGGTKLPPEPPETSRQRLKTLPEINMAVRAQVSLRSVRGSLTEKEVGEMLKQKNFFSKQYDRNKHLSNPRGDFANEYEVKMIHGDKVVLDHATGLMWHQSGSKGEGIYAAKNNTVDNLNLRDYAGYSDWRLPTLEEAASLIERSKMNGGLYIPTKFPATQRWVQLYIDPIFSVQQRYIWTSDTVSEANRAWVVSFLTGSISTVIVDPHFNYNYVRPVRSVEEPAKIREEALKIWDDWQNKMNSDFRNVEDLDKNPASTREKKKTTWEQFLRHYDEKNPFATKDDELRQRAEHRIKELSKPEISAGTRVSLRSSAHGLSVKEGKSMVKRKNFFDSDCNKSGGFGNEYESKTINGDKVVLDHATGLMWHKSGSEEYITYKNAKRWVFNLNYREYAGYSDWRLPTLEEGASLLEKSKMNGGLYVDSKFSTKQIFIWTSDWVTDLPPGWVWYVNFNSGHVRGVNFDSTMALYCFVRPVRNDQKDGKEVLLTSDLNSKQRNQYDEESVRRIILDITLAGTYAYFNAHRDEVNPREALRRWDAGVRVRNADRFVRKIVGGNWRHTYKGTTTKIDGMEVLLTTDLNSKQCDQYNEESVRLIVSK